MGKLIKPLNYGYENMTDTNGTFSTYYGSVNSAKVRQYGKNVFIQFHLSDMNLQIGQSAGTYIGTISGVELPTVPSHASGDYVIGMAILAEEEPETLGEGMLHQLPVVVTENGDIMLVSELSDSSYTAMFARGNISYIV